MRVTCWHPVAGWLAGAHIRPGDPAGREARRGAGRPLPPRARARPGGMATVYLAEDLKHHRKVAVKVLRPRAGRSRSAPSGSCARSRSRPTLTSPPHPRRCTTPGEAAGLLYYVMPYVEGRVAARAAGAREAAPGRGGAPDRAARWRTRWTTPTSRACPPRHQAGEHPASTAGHAVVADFGIARAIDAAGEASG